MDSKGYLTRYGWKEGEALQQGGLKRPILVKQKRDNKGLGHDAGDSVAWWEQIFDGQLKSLDVSSGDKGVTFSQNEEKVAEFNKSQSPLYKMFVKGKGLAGTIEESKKKRKSNEGVVHFIEKKRRKVKPRIAEGSIVGGAKKQKSQRKEEKRIKRQQKEEKRLKKQRREEEKRLRKEEKRLKSEKKEEKQRKKLEKQRKKLEKQRKEDVDSKKKHKKH